MQKFRSEPIFRLHLVSYCTLTLKTHGIVRVTIFGQLSGATLLDITQARHNQATFLVYPLGCRQHHGCGYLMGMIVLYFYAVRESRLDFVPAMVDDYAQSQARASGPTDPNIIQL